MMTIIKQPDILPLRSIAATIGMFDGTHLGHQHVMAMLCREATKRGLKAAVITFAKHPQLLFSPDSDLRMIMSLDDRLAHLAELDVDYAILLDFDRALSQLSASEFIRFIRDHYGISLLIIGYNHRFGHNREESFNDYVLHGKELGVEIIKADEYFGEYYPISSSIIRRLISSGKVDDAAKCLSRPFKMHGRVIHGFQNGRKLGFPTANITPTDADIIIPHQGVYAVNVVLDSGEVYGGMANIGIRPTYNNGETPSIEVHIFNFNGDLYGTVITIEFVKFIRSEYKMNSIEELRQQLIIDAKEVHKILNDNNIQ